MQQLSTDDQVEVCGGEGGLASWKCRQKKLTYVRYSLSSQTKVNVASPMRCFKLQRIVMYPSVHSTQVESEE